MAGGDGVTEVMMYCLGVASSVALLFLTQPLLAASDPFEPLNRKSDRFNQVFDNAITKPVARGYTGITPRPVRRAVNNFFGNLADVSDLANNLLQGKPGDSISDLLRISINSTVGIGGLFDPASRLGLVDHDEDFGQTLSTWGVPAGPYLVIPFIGPSNVRNALSFAVNYRTRPLLYLHPVDHRNTLLGFRLIHERAELLKVEDAIFGDRYIFIREAYQQQRRYLDSDGEVEDLFGDEF